MNVGFSSLEPQVRVNNVSSTADARTSNPASQAVSEGERQGYETGLRIEGARFRAAETNLKAAEYEVEHRQEMVSTGFPSRILEMTEQLNAASSGEQADIRAYIDSLKAALAEDTAWLKENLPNWPETRASLQAQVDEQRARIDLLRAGGLDS